MTWDRLHDEDVLYEFTGDQPNELSPGRFYRGRVDGFADFGVFVTIGDSVTGLLHRSNLDGRLENLDWEVGDAVIVQVRDVQENGNVDLGWSIRQSSTEFRGEGVDGPDKEDPDVAPPAAEEPDAPVETGDQDIESPATPTLEPVSIAEATDLDGDRVRLHGQITDIHQTSGPTIFTLTDETGEIECAAFESAGVRAFPEIETNDVVSLIGWVERHRGAVQIETEEMSPLPEEQRNEVLERVKSAEDERVRPDETQLLTPDDRLTEELEAIIDVATALRRAVHRGQSVVIRHPTSVAGVVAGAALERALRSYTARIHEEHAASDWFVTRRPMEDPWYDLRDAMYDVTDGSDRGDLIVLVGAGVTEADEAACTFLDLYGVDRVIIDAYDRPVMQETSGVVNSADSSVPTLATTVAAMVDETVRPELVHLPAIGMGRDTPNRYRQLADDGGYTVEAIQERHEAIALVAYYQRYDDKRELIEDLLFDGEEAGELSRHVSEQFRTRLSSAVETAQENAHTVDISGDTGLVLDAATLMPRFAFPPHSVLADALYRESDSDLVLVLDQDACYLAGDRDQDLESLATTVDRDVPNADVQPGRDRLTFLAGKRDAVREGILTAMRSQPA